MTNPPVPTGATPLFVELQVPPVIDAVSDAELPLHVADGPEIDTLSDVVVTVTIFVADPPANV